MTAIPFDHLHKLIHIGTGEIRVTLRGLDELVHKGHRRLVFHINAILVAEVQKVLTGRIVGSANEIDVGFPEKPDIGFHLGWRHGTACQQVNIVAVHTPQLDGAAIDVQLPAHNLKGADTKPTRNRLGDYPMGMQFHGQLIEVGVFGIPQDRIWDNKG